MKYLNLKSMVILAGAGIIFSACQNGESKEVDMDTAAPAANMTDISNATPDVQLDKLNLPEGFEINVWAADVPNARSLAISDNGTIFVGNRQEDKVYAVVDTNADGVADKRYTLASDLNLPNGVAFKEGNLYVAEVNRILRFSDIENNLGNPSFDVIFEGYPEEKHHGWKFIAFGPDGMLYVPVGAPCNICESEDEVFASITRIDVKSANPQPEVFAHGVRNTVGFDWDPQTGNLWFTDNGRDMMGDDIPDCELNVADKAGDHFGYPYWHAGSVKDPDFGNEGEGQSSYIAPAAKLGAHVAPLGIRFYEGGMFPGEFKNLMFIAKHGSWNRSKKSGYTITVAKKGSSNSVASESDFITGWLDDESQEVWGRPVDVQELPDGSLLISDDLANVIYRVTYKG